ncbi:hypothetical protein KFL_000500040 [Klebsormidium nitens]|uniref:Uncharacterized protein n=1 Tax=Klebsormidium nitens TaxID=105231 RepID=A0A1Y1HR29_KLENI|nr:hypothetical protein KFL_000500040 [Klebsormidium nitens]|eukprot:GAQ80252.1 hypothetical protein KFL_000500040 [Klebsormidium nitens]
MVLLLVQRLLQNQNDAETAWAGIEADDYAELVRELKAHSHQTRGRDNVEKEERIRDAIVDAQLLFPDVNLRPALEQILQQYEWDGWPFLSNNQHAELKCVLAGMQEGGRLEQPFAPTPTRASAAGPKQTAAAGERKKKATRGKVVTRKVVQEEEGTPKLRALPFKPWVSWPAVYHSSCGAWETPDSEEERSNSQETPKEETVTAGEESEEGSSESDVIVVKRGRKRQKKKKWPKRAKAKASEVEPAETRVGAITSEQAEQAASFLSHFNCAPTPKSPSKRHPVRPGRKAPAEFEPPGSPLKQTSILNFVSVQSPKVAPALAAGRQNGGGGSLEQTTESLGIVRGLDETFAGPTRPTSGKRMVIDTSSDESDVAEPSRQQKREAASGKPCLGGARSGAEGPSEAGGASRVPQQPGFGTAVDGGKSTPTPGWDDRGVGSKGGVRGRASKRQAVVFWEEQSRRETQGEGRRQEGRKGGEACRREGNKAGDKTSNGPSGNVRKAGLLSPD